VHEDQIAGPTDAASHEGGAVELSLRHIFRSSSRIWRRDLGILTVLAAGLELPLFFAEVVLHVTPGLHNLRNESATVSWALAMVALYGSLSHHLLAGLLEGLVASERHGHPKPSLREVLSGLPWARLLVADLLLAGMIAVGLAAFVVPGLVVMTWFAIALPILNMERGTVRGSFLRSYRLIRGHSWRSGLLAFASFAVPDLLVGLVVVVVHHFTSDSIAIAAAHAVPATVLLPIAALPLVVLAFDLVGIERTSAGRSHRVDDLAREGGGES
jgi:hypothetical protein